MPDILAGATIKAADFPPASRDSSNVSQVNVTATPTEGSPVVATTFVAPTSGKVEIVVGGAIQDDTASSRGFIEPQVFEGGDATGAEVAAVGTARRYAQRGTTGAAPEFGSRSTLLAGLTPGQTYYARVMVYASGGTTVDIIQRSIEVFPTT
jgi:hypothetical protein